MVALAPQNRGASWGGQNKLDYAITIDMAKELCMVENNELGRKARRYFIECEKKLQSQTLMLTKEQEFAARLLSTDDKIECALIMKEYGEYKSQKTKQILEETVIIPLENKVEEQKPLVELCLKRRTSEGLVTFTDISKTFGLKKGQLGVWAKTNGYIHKTQKEVNNKGDKYFRVYGDEYPNIGLTEDGVRLVESNLDDIKQSPCKIPKK